MTFRKIKRILSQTLLLILASLSSSCASIISDKNYPINIESAPSGAEFKIYDEDNKVVRSGTTPSSIILPAGGAYFDIYHYTVEYNKPGYAPNKEIIKTSLDPWFWGNIALGGLIGMLIVDPITGSMYQIDDKTVTVTLQPVSSSSRVPYKPTDGTGTPAAENIRELRQLLDERLITPADYEKKKNEMLKKM